MPQQYRYHCHCGKSLVLKDNFIGRTGRCSCGAKIRITRELLDKLAEGDQPVGNAAAKRTADQAANAAVQVATPPPAEHALEKAQKPGHEEATEVDVPLEWAM